METGGRGSDKSKVKGQKQGETERGTGTRTGGRETGDKRQVGTVTGDMERQGTWI